MDSISHIKVRSAKEHNLKSIDVDIPRDVGDFRLMDRKVVDKINTMTY